MTPAPLDLFIIGGGINGCAVARDAVGRRAGWLMAQVTRLQAFMTAG